MPVDISVTIDTRGALFDRGLQRGLVQGLNEGIDTITKIGESEVKKQLYPGHGFQTGRLREAVAGDLIEDLRGVVDAGQHVEGRNVVYADWIEGISPRNRTTRFKGYRMFRFATKLIEALPMNEIIGGKIMRYLR